MTKVEYKVVDMSKYRTGECFENLLNEMVNDKWELDHVYGPHFIFKRLVLLGLVSLQPENKKTTVDLTEAKAEVVHLNSAIGIFDRMLQITFNDDIVFRFNCKSGIQFAREFNQFIKGL